MGRSHSRGRQRAARRGWALCALLAACSRIVPGPDDDAPLRDGGPTETTSSAGASSAGAPSAGASSAGASSEDTFDASRSPFTIEVVFVLDSNPTYGCAAGFDPSAAQADPIAAFGTAAASCQCGEGRWSCSCDGATDTRYTATCIGALLEACGVDAEPFDGAAPLPRDCEATLSDRAGRCEQRSSGAYACRCANQPETVITRDDASCEPALWAACALGCSDAFGTCLPTPGGRAGAYRCHSLANGLDHDVHAASCVDALYSGLEVVVESADGCNGYGGYCDRIDENALRCTCALGSVGEVQYDSDRYASCRIGLEAICGTGEPPTDAFCTLEANDYAARCTRAPAADAPHTCECMLQGAARNSPYTLTTVEGLSCEAALSEACPQTLPLTEAARTATCDHYTKCDTHFLGFERDDCLANGGKDVQHCNFGVGCVQAGSCGPA